MKKFNHKYIPALVFISLCLIWSSTWVVIKIGLDSLPPFLAAAIRFLVAYAILSLYALKKNLNPPTGLRVHLFFLWFGILNFTGGYALVYWGEKYIASGLTSVLFSVMPFYVLILSIWLLPQETIGIKKTTGVILGFLGIIIIFNDQLDFNNLDSNILYGMTAVIIAPVFTSLGTITAKRKGKDFNPIVLITIPMLYASILFFILSSILERHSYPVFDFKAVFSIIYLAFFGTAVAFILYFWMLKNTSAVLMSMITFVTPPLALIWGWIILNEKVSYLLILGLLTIFSGIVLVRKS